MQKCHSLLIFSFKRQSSSGAKARGKQKSGSGVGRRRGVCCRAGRCVCQSKKHRARSANCVQAQPGRGEETRTPDILLPKQARYQLRYTSIKSQRFQTAFYCNGFPPRSQGNPAEFREFPERNCRMGRGIRSTAQIRNRGTEAPAYRHAANTGANNGDTNHHTATGTQQKYQNGKRQNHIRILGKATEKRFLFSIRKLPFPICRAIGTCYNKRNAGNPPGFLSISHKFRALFANCVRPPGGHRHANFL